MFCDRQFGNARRCDTLVQRTFLRTEQRSERFRRKAGVLHRIRADKHRIGGTVVRQHDAVAVGDPSARRDHGDLAGPLVKRKIAQVLPVHHLQIKETRENEKKKKGYCQNNGK